MIVNMKPYDPEHKGEFCTRNGRKVTLWETRLRRNYSLAGVVHYEDYDVVAAWTEKGEFFEGRKGKKDLMCVIPKREARVITFDEDGVFFGPTSLADVAFREVMPDDISQEKAQAVIEAARAVVKAMDDNHPGFGTWANATNDLRAALGDDA